MKTSRFLSVAAVVFAAFALQACSAAEEESAPTTGDDQNQTSSKPGACGKAEVTKLAQAALKADDAALRMKVTGDAFKWVFDGVTFTQRASKKTMTTVSTIGMASDDLDVIVTITTDASCKMVKSHVDLDSLDDG
jgi:hypothetical protein